jgi:hypothetical protein
MKSKHWLAGVARILRADTDDLRELARLGGVDPRTAYIGTRLEGVDLRGQDLRGMLFSDLDLAHVRHDAETLIDPDQLAQPSRLDVGSVFIASPLMVEDPLVGFLTGYGAKVFHSKQAAEFQASLGPRTPGIVLAWAEEVIMTHSPLDQLERLDRHLVHVVVGRHPAGLREQWHKSWPSATVVFCANSQRSGMTLGVRSKTDVRSLCSLLLGHWDELRPRLSGSSVFLRAKGLAPAPWLDASAQVFEQIWRMGLQYNSLFLAGPFDRWDSAEMEGVRTLLRPESLVELSPFRNELCAFVDADTSLRGLKESVDYSEAAIAAAQAAHGLVEEPLTVRDARGGRMGLGRADFGRRPTKPVSLDGRQLQKFDFSEISTVVIIDRADAAYVAERLVLAHELWITPRDLLGGGAARGMTIWTLIAAQLRRFYGSSGPGYQALLRLVVQAAMRKHLDRETALNTLNFGGLIRASNLEYRGDEAAMRVQIAMLDEAPTTFALVFDERGPRIPSEFAFLDQVVGQTTPSDGLPAYREIEQALLAHLLDSGPVEPKDVYGALADRFGLSETQRTTTRRDNSTPLWNNRVQWARRALNEKGYLAPRRGVWALTAEGLKAAGEFRGPWARR